MFGISFWWFPMCRILFEQPWWPGHEQHWFVLELQIEGMQNHQQITTPTTKWSNQLSASFLVFANLSMDVNPKQQITIHSTASTNSLDGAMSWGDNELWAIVPNKMNDPTIPTNRLELNSPLSPWNIWKIFFICLDRDIFLRVYYSLSEHLCFCALALVANSRRMMFLPLPLF